MQLPASSIKSIARLVGLDVKTVRRYVREAESRGLHRGDGPESLTEDQLCLVMEGLSAMPPRLRGESWERCEAHRGEIEHLLSGGRVRLTKVGKLLRRQGIEIPYGTLYRFARERLSFGRQAATIAVLDGEPGEELEVDTGWVGWLEREGNGRRRRLKCFIFTPVLSRYRFVYPISEESTAAAIEACEAAWKFYGGVFRVLIPENVPRNIFRILLPETLCSQ